MNEYKVVHRYFRTKIQKLWFADNVTVISTDVPIWWKSIWLSKSERAIESIESILRTNNETNINIKNNRKCNVLQRTGKHKHWITDNPVKQGKTFRYLGSKITETEKIPWILGIILNPH